MNETMNCTIFFADRIMTISDRRPDDDAPCVRTLEDGEPMPRAEALRLLSECGGLAVVTSEPERVFASFAAEFVQVEAAGGVVLDDAGRALMIYRNNRWDLPKGHLETGETLAQCALREVKEETGIDARHDRSEELCATLHCYNLYGKWEMKRTHWYSMRYAGGHARPQAEEGIQRAEWLEGGELENAVRQSYPTIRQVFCRLRGE